MHSQTLVSPDRGSLAPVAEDFSGWFCCGRIHAGDARPGLDAAAEAEQLGYRRLFLSERHNLKEAGALLGGLAARTSRLGVGTGVIAPRSRNPLMTAALGATLHAAYGPRFTLGLGRSEASFFPGQPQAGYQELVDYTDIVRRLWRGETVTYDGPAGRYEKLSMLGDTYPGPHPEVWIGTLGLEKGATAAAMAFDGVLLWPYLSLAACETVVSNIREACERVGRDPASIRICLPVVTTPDFSEAETFAVAYARLVTYITWPPNCYAYFKVNDWDPSVVDKLLAHPLLSTLAAGDVADLSFHREDLLELAALIPEHWVTDTCAVGSVDHCVRFLQSYRDIGVDEIATYGSDPSQNAALIEAWRARPEAGRAT